MKKNIALVCLSLIFLSQGFSEGSEIQKKFIRGNIADKTSAVKLAEGNEAVLLSKEALVFSMENKEMLGEDRDLAALCVAAVLSVPSNYILNAGEEEKKWFFDSFYKIYNTYSDTTVEIAVLNKIAGFNEQNVLFAKMLNDYLKSRTGSSADSSLLKTVILTLGKIGNDESFMILYAISNDPSWKNYENETKAALSELSEKALNSVLALIQRTDTAECRRIFDFSEKNERNSNIFKAQIAENVLSRTIYIAESSNASDSELIKLQLDAYNVLVQLNWTRSADTVVLFYDKAKSLYENGSLSENDFIKVIFGLRNTVPLKAVSMLSGYLNTINKKMEENSSSVSETLVLSIIQTLGAIGDKNAFDSLLSVTYYNYSDNVISAARDALARLKW